MEVSELYNELGFEAFLFRWPKAHYIKYIKFDQPPWDNNVVDATFLNSYIVIFTQKHLINEACQVVFM